MVREIAQIVGRETKYPNVLSAILRIGDEEGPRGFFAGLIPYLVADYLVIWLSAGLRYGAERIMQEYKVRRRTLIKTLASQLQVDEPNDEASKKAAKDTRFMLNFAIPFVANSFSYPFSVVSTVLAVSGSGFVFLLLPASVSYLFSLVVSLLPYSPSFVHWQDTYDYLKPYGLARGNRLFLRYGLDLNDGHYV